MAIQIDLTNTKSWDLNTGLTVFSITKWSGAISDNINLINLGLTGFDNGRTNIMWSGITLTPLDSLFSMYRVGYNDVNNPATGETSGITTITQYLPISAVTTTDTTGNYFNLNGGYLQGFFKLFGYNYELLPARYNNGITIETLVNLYPNSHGIFYMMGARAEDKYNPYFSGETITGTTTIGVVDSDGNYLDAILNKQVLKTSFSLPEEKTYTSYYETSPINNIKNNIIAFELTENKKLGYRYINNDGIFIKNESLMIVNETGFTTIAISFTPNSKIDDISKIDCAKQRIGKLRFYVNGRNIWTVADFPEFYFKSFANDREKQIGVPYSISWGGGSFGLSNSWHYNYQTYTLYSGQDSTYINNKFVIESNPTGNTGLVLTGDNTTFAPEMVMRVNCTGGTGNTYHIKFNQPISVLSNRDYVVNLSIYNQGLFNPNANNKISIIPVSSTVDINVIKDTEYVYPITEAYFENITNTDGTNPFADGQEYEYSLNGTIYYGVSGIPLTLENMDINGNEILIPNTQNSIMTGTNTWLPISSTFRTTDNTGQNFIHLNILIESDNQLLSGGTLFIKDFTYSASDILVKDDRKNNLLIEQNFNSGFVGGIQKLRIYDRALSSSEILNNTMFEAKTKPNIVVNKGGRIIYR